MPGSARTASRLADLNVPPNAGQVSSTAWSMPGSLTSMPNSGLPATMAGVSTPPTDCPMIWKFAGSFSLSVAGSGAGSFAAAPASVAYGIDLPVLGSVTLPLPVVSISAATPHCAAAAATSIARAAAPACRMGSHSRGVVRLPPALCPPKILASAWVCSMLTCAQSTSSSSAMSIGSIVLAPWPISAFFAPMMTRLSGRMRMKALMMTGVPSAAFAIGTARSNSNPPPAISDAEMNPRRESVARLMPRPL